MKGMAYNGWKHGLPDKFWSVTLDNFFDNPDEIRELGLRMIESDKVTTLEDDTNIWPGCRSEKLEKINRDLEERCTDKILNCYFNLNFEQVFWNFVDMRFNLIPSFDKDKNNLKNKGWIHRDSHDPRIPYGLSRIDQKKITPREMEELEEPNLAGLIYLTPDIERNTGTSLFNMKKDKTLDDYNSTVGSRAPLFRGDPVSDEEYKEQWERHRSCFIEKVRFENVYNRLIMYDTREWHGANSYYTPEDNRLTLGFFIGGIRANKWPLERVREVEIC